jgi:hypothetical protein
VLPRALVRPPPAAARCPTPGRVAAVRLPSSSDQREELRRLQVENRRLRQEREILKRAAFFARETETQTATALPGVELGLLEPGAQRLLRDAEVLGHVAHRAAFAAHERDGLAANSSGYGGRVRGTDTILPAWPDGASVQVSIKAGALH